MAEATAPASGAGLTAAGRWRRYGIDLLTVFAALLVGALGVAVLEQLGLEDASPGFLLAVVAVAVIAGTGPALATAIGAFLVYDFFFIAPQYTLTVGDAGEWLNLILLLVVGLVVGRLAGRARDREVAAIRGEQAANALATISFTLATNGADDPALVPLAEVVRDQTGSERVWIVVGERLAADTAAPSEPPGSPSVVTVLRRRPGVDPAEWVRIHAPARGGPAKADRSVRSYRVAIAAGDRTYGALWSARVREAGDPDASQTRVLATAADQIGGALERERLQGEATSAEISRRSEALKSALLDSVSHDLRTPLASIRAAAGSLMDPDVTWAPEQERTIATSIDREAEWLNRLVTNLLDMSRVEAGELRPHLAVFDVGDLISATVERAGVVATGRALTIDLPATLPPVVVDEVFLGQAVANVLDNALKYAGPDAPIRISGSVTPAARVTITIEDGGPGVPEDALPRLFEKFYRVPRRGEGSRRGTGIGLAVVRGLVEAMDGAVVARPSELGGLAVDLDLPIAAPQGDEAVDGSDEAGTA